MKKIFYLHYDNYLEEENIIIKNKIEEKYYINKSIYISIKWLKMNVWNKSYSNKNNNKKCGLKSLIYWNNIKNNKKLWNYQDVKYFRGSIKNWYNNIYNIQPRLYLEIVIADVLRKAFIEKIGKIICNEIIEEIFKYFYSY
jgi:hypothetical protein